MPWLKREQLPVDMQTDEVIDQLPTAVHIDGRVKYYLPDIPIGTVELNERGEKVIRLNVPVGDDEKAPPPYSENVTREDISKAVENLGGEMSPEAQEQLYEFLNDTSTDFGYGCVLPVVSVVLILLPVIVLLLIARILLY